MTGHLHRPGYARNIGADLSSLGANVLRLAVFVLLVGTLAVLYSAILATARPIPVREGPPLPYEQREPRPEPIVDPPASAAPAPTRDGPIAGGANPAPTPGSALGSGSLGTGRVPQTAGRLERTLVMALT